MTKRGPEPSDARHFHPNVVPTLQEATADLSWLRGRGYSDVAALKLVGDRFQLAKRQRHAIVRAACSNAQRDERAARCVAVDGKPVAVDGFNALLVLERAMGGGPVFVGRDGAVRDIGGVHGTYRTVEHTPAVVELLANWFDEAGAAQVEVMLDRPVSNSGKLAGLIRDTRPDWVVEVVDQVDRRLAASDAVVCTGDAWILDHAAAWTDAVGQLVASWEAWVVDLRS